MLAIIGFFVSDTIRMLLTHIATDVDKELPLDINSGVVTARDQNA